MMRAFLRWLFRGRISKALIQDLKKLKKDNQKGGEW